ncbi:MAG: hypothetical protein RL514_850 [Verrucomicrobiota bacterium]|jgi:hypothetical protein
MRLRVTSDWWQVASGTTRPATVRSLSAVRCPLSAAFTLLEVMIAIGIFFMCVFVILELVSTNLRHIQHLQKPTVDIGSLASELSLTNKLEEGGDSGNFGSLYPGVSWSREITMVGTNGLFQVDFTVQDGSGGGRFPVQSRLSIFLYRPESKQGITLK